MRINKTAFWAIFILAGISSGAYAFNDTSTRAMGLGQSYTALAHGSEAPFWNPANLALGGGAGFSWDILSFGFTFIAENNSFSPQTYNDYFSTKSGPILAGDKDGLLGDIDEDGWRINMDFGLNASLLLPLANKGVTFKMPWDIHSAVAIGVETGVEGAVPKDLFDLMFNGNDFNRKYDIADWDGSGWGIWSLNWSGAKAWMPPQFKPYLSEFTAGATLKLMMGGFGEVVESEGTLVSYFNDPVGGTGTDIEAELGWRKAGGGALAWIWVWPELPWIAKPPSARACSTSWTPCRGALTPSKGAPLSWPTNCF